LKTSAIAELPKTESQARPLAKLPPDQQDEAWTAANKKAESEGRKVSRDTSGNNKQTRG